MLHRLVGLIHKLTDCAAVLAGLVVVALMVSMVYEVVLRYFFNAPTMWAFEMSYMFMGTSFALAIAYALKQRTHVRMDLLYDQLAPRSRAIIDLVGFGLLVLPLTLWLTWRLGWYAQHAYVTLEVSGKSAWNPQVWHFRAALCVGFLVFSLQLIAEVIEAARVLFGGRPEAPEGSDTAGSAR